MNPDRGGVVVPLGHENRYQNKKSKKQGPQDGHDDEGAALNTGKEFSAGDDENFVHAKGWVGLAKDMGCVSGWVSVAGAVFCVAQVVVADCLNKDVLKAWEFFGEMQNATVAVVMVDEFGPMLGFGLKDHAGDSVGL